MSALPAWIRANGLTGEPFEKDVSDERLWLPSSREAVVEELVEAMHARQHALVVGEPGVGKTCTIRALRHRLRAGSFRMTYCHNATLGRRDFYRHLCLGLNIPAKTTAASVFFELQSHVTALAAERTHPVFIVDEAQLLQDQVLGHLHVFMNYEWDRAPLMSLVLVGLPDLWRRLHVGVNRSLWSRIHTRIHLEPASPQDTAEYVEHRLALVGGKPSLFSSDAIALLHEHSGGQLRDLDRLARTALREAGRRKIKLVDQELMLRAINASAAPD